MTDPGFAPLERPAWEPPPPPEPSGLERLERAPWVRRVLAAAVAVLLVASSAAAALGAGDRSGRAAGPGTGDEADEAAEELTPEERAAREAELRAVIPELERFVQEARGLTFKEPVEIEFVSDDEMRRRINEDDVDDPEASAKADEADEDLEGVLQALGLLEPDVDLAEERDELLGEAVAGFYDPETDELVVRGQEPTASVRATIAHELVHALEDQHFDLHRPDLEDRDDEAQTAFRALVEGSAKRIEQAYLASLSASDRREAAEEEGEISGRLDPDVPVVLLVLLGFPYFAGEPLVEAIVEAGGQSRLDQSYAAPPVSSEQVLHPNRYLLGDAPKAVSEPRAGGEVIDEGVLGELGLLLVLQAVLPQERAAAAAEGWGADRYVAWHDGDRTCVRAVVVMDDRTEREELRGALDAWKDGRRGADVTSSGDRTTLTACG